MSTTDNPNADYDTILDSSKKAFADVYDEVMTKIAKEFQLPVALQEQLSAKRAFGLEKYGERAFQSTIENAIASPVAAHLGDEIVDAFNYALHGFYISNMLMVHERRKAYENVLNSLVDVIVGLHKLHEVLEEGDEKEALKWTVEVE